jgi:glycosyltransferase involved in cell wall biosynthesis
MTSAARLPLLTIVTINRNNATGLGRTILSVLPLLSAEVHYVVVDGASGDESLQVAQSLLARRDHVRIVSEVDEGIYDAMNKGWQMSSSEYVAFLNSGDEVVPDAYARFLSAIEMEGRLADVVYGRVFLARDDGVRLGTHERHPEHLRSDTLPHPAAVVRRTMLARLGGFDQRFRIVADRDLFIRAYKQQASFLHVSETVAIFYLGGVSSGWRAGLESATLSRLHGYVGFFGWAARIGWIRMVTSAPINEAQKFVLLQRGRAFCAGIMRFTDRRDSR